MITEEQKQERKRGLGGSDIAPILGLSPFTTPLQVFLEKTGQSEGNFQNKYMKVGQYLEPAIIKMYEDEINCKIMSIDSLSDKEHPFLMGNVDGKHENKNIMLEVKTARKTAEWGEPGTANIPPYYLCQVAHYSYLSNCEKMDIAVLFMDTRDFVVYTYQRDERLENIIKKKAIDFWMNHVTTGIPPKPINEEDLKFFAIIDDPKLATLEIEREVLELKKIKMELKEIEKKEASVKGKILMYLENHKTLIDSGSNVLATYRQNKDSQRFDLETFKKEHGDMASRYLKSTPGARVLTLK